MLARYEKVGVLFIACRNIMISVMLENNLACSSYDQLQTYSHTKSYTCTYGGFPCNCGNTDTIKMSVKKGINLWGTLLLQNTLELSYQHLVIPGGILSTYFKMKDTSLRRSHIIWFMLYDILEMKLSRHHISVFRASLEWESEVHETFGGHETIVYDVWIHDIIYLSKPVEHTTQHKERTLMYTMDLDQYWFIYGKNMYHINTWLLTRGRLWNGER